MDLGKIWSKLRRNLGKIEVKFGQKWLDLGKIKILHPQKHSISFGYGLNIMDFNIKALLFSLFLLNQTHTWRSFRSTNKITWKKCY